MILFQRLRAFCKGASEFRSDLTTSYSDEDLFLAYEWGREWAHRLTFRRFE